MQRIVIDKYKHGPLFWAAVALSLLAGAALFTGALIWTVAGEAAGRVAEGLARRFGLQYRKKQGR